MCNSNFICLVVISVALLDIFHTHSSDTRQSPRTIKPFCNGNFYNETKYCGIGILTKNNKRCIAWRYYTVRWSHSDVQNTTLCELQKNDPKSMCAISNYSRGVCKNIKCVSTKSKNNICDSKIFWSSASSWIKLDFSQFENTTELLILSYSDNGTCLIAKICQTCASADRVIQSIFSSCDQVPAMSDNSDIIIFSNLTHSTVNQFYLIPLINSYTIGTIFRLSLATQITVPRAPTGISINILVNWNKNEDTEMFGPAEKYEIEIRNSSSKSILETYNVHTNNLFVNQSQTSQQNCLSVIAVNSAGRSNNSEEHCIFINRRQTEQIPKPENHESENHNILAFVIYGLLLLLIVVFASIVFWKMFNSKGVSKMLASKHVTGISTQTVNGFEMESLSKSVNEHDEVIGEFMNLSNETIKMERQTQLTTFIANLPENKNKNRCPGIVPYDNSRVILEDDIYINATNIPFVDDANHLEFIACQGPVAESIHDFWTMIWENNISMIVMLSRVYEQGRFKCMQYWPSNTKNREYYGRNLEILVLLDHESHGEEFVERQFLITHEITKEERIVTQLQLISWKSSHAPNVNNFEQLVNRFNEITSSSTDQPCLVHCSTGVGRSGVFIVTIRLMRKKKNQPKKLDVFREVMDLRKYNGHMVLRQNQYIFLYELVEFLSEKEFSRTAELCAIFETEHVYGTIFD